MSRTLSTRSCLSGREESFSTNWRRPRWRTESIVVPTMCTARPYEKQRPQTIDLRAPGIAPRGRPDCMRQGPPVRSRVPLCEVHTFGHGLGRHMLRPVISTARAANSLRIAVAGRNRKGGGSIEAAAAWIRQVRCRRMIAEARKHRPAHRRSRADDPEPVSRRPREARQAANRPAAGPQATAPRPFFSTGVGSFSDAPCGRFSPRSRWLTRSVVASRWRANTGWLACSRRRSARMSGRHPLAPPCPNGTKNGPSAAA